jgi:hypothetical protein
MNLYIETENGTVKNHPAFEENLIQAFGHIPENWQPFNRIVKPNLSAYELLVSESPTYEKVEGVWTDVWHKRDMTVEEKTAKQQAVIDVFNSHPQASNWSAWAFDEVTCTMQPPILRPVPDQAKLKQRIFTFWCGAESNWKDTPVCPVGDYEFDFFTWNWMEVTP